MELLDYDVLVVGAGAAGLISAYEIASGGKKVAILEAKDKVGGRIATVEKKSICIELGAEFVHGNLPLTQRLLEKAGAKTYPVEGSIWQYKNGSLQQQEDFIEDEEALKRKLQALSNDQSIAAFLHQDLSEDHLKNLRFSVRNYVEGYYAADISKASTLALKEEWMRDNAEQYRVNGGYQQLVAYLVAQCRLRGVQFFLAQPVLEIRWKKGGVNVTTTKNSFAGKNALITVSVGVLQKGSIHFVPSLPAMEDAIQTLGFGHVVKPVMLFRIPFWKEAALTREKDLADHGFLFSEEAVPTWWTHFPKNENILTGWIGGPEAKKLKSATVGEIQTAALSSLSRIFGSSVERMLEALDEMVLYNWSADPHFCGAYSYEVVGGGEAIQKMLQPVEGTIFFAGEGLHQGPQIGTVEGALQSGKSTAHRLLAMLKL
jgi:monoamine oxidase